MGVNVSNVEELVDHTTGEHYINLHRRIEVPADRWEGLTRALAERNWDAVRDTLRALAPENAADTIDAMLAPEALQE
ncbi:MAG: hypothetical protein IH881_20355 [Myxococcales bacterium]|nr:hypothetical protein [Myxococcales bacterium]